jgi:hypothetical protein
MLRWIWRLMLLASGALVAGTGWAWHRSFDRAEAVFIQRGTRYMQATAQRGRIDVFWIDNYPATKDGKPLRGYSPDAIDHATGYLKGATTFHMQSAFERARGPVRFSEGSVQADIDPLNTRNYPWLLRGVEPPVASPEQIAQESAESAADSKFTLHPSAKIRSEPPESTAQSLDSSRLTLASSLKPPSADKPRASVVISGGRGGLMVSDSSAISGRAVPQRLAFFPSWPAFTYHAVSIPHRLVLAVMSLPLAAAIGGLVNRQRIRGQRRRYGQCLDCGYDLRANLDGRCPECGAAASPDR